MQIYSLKFLYKHSAGAFLSLEAHLMHPQNVYTKTLDYKFAYGYFLFRCIEFRNYSLLASFRWSSFPLNNSTKNFKCWVTLSTEMIIDRELNRIYTYRWNYSWHLTKAGQSRALIKLLSSLSQSLISSIPFIIKTEIFKR